MQAEQFRAFGTLFQCGQKTSDHFFQQFIFTGHSRCGKCRCSMLTMSFGNLEDAFGIAIHEIRISASVDMQIDESRKDIIPFGINDFRFGRTRLIDRCDSEEIPTGFSQISI